MSEFEISLSIFFFKMYNRRRGRAEAEEDDEEYQPPRVRRRRGSSNGASSTTGSIYADRSRMNLRPRPANRLPVSPVIHIQNYQSTINIDHPVVQVGSLTRNEEDSSSSSGVTAPQQPPVDQQMQEVEDIINLLSEEEEEEEEEEAGFQSYERIPTQEDQVIALPNPYELEYIVDGKTTYFYHWKDEDRLELEMVRDLLPSYNEIIANNLAKKPALPQYRDIINQDIEKAVVEMSRVEQENRELASQFMDDYFKKEQRDAWMKKFKLNKKKIKMYRDYIDRLLYHLYT